MNTSHLAVPVARAFQTWLCQNGLSTSSAVHYAKVVQRIQKSLDAGDTLEVAVAALPMSYQSAAVPAWNRYAHYSGDLRRVLGDRAKYDPGTLIALKDIQTFLEVALPITNQANPRILAGRALIKFIEYLSFLPQVFGSHNKVLSMIPQTRWSAFRPGQKSFADGAGLGKVMPFFFPGALGVENIYPLEGAYYEALRTLYQWGDWPSEQEAQQMPLVPLAPRDPFAMPTFGLRALMREATNMGHKG